MPSHPLPSTGQQPIKASFKTGRRQHRSCDQCRKGKRACDVAFAKESGGGSDDIAALGPCSNCRRTGKSCTLQWLRAVHRASLRPHRDLDTPTTVDTLLTDDTTTPPTTTTPPAQISASESLPSTCSFSYSPSAVNEPVMAALLPPPEQRAQANQLLEQQQQHPFTDPWPSSGLDSLPLRSIANTLDDTLHFHDTRLHTLNHQHHHEQRQQNNYQHAFLPLAPPVTSAAWEHNEQDPSVPDAVEQHVGGDVSNRRERQRSDGIVSWRRPSSTSFGSVVEQLQPSTLQDRLSSTMNQSVLSKGLWKVYHDSFENALSCWLTEKTCPYTASAPGLALTASDTGGSGGESLSQVWGPSWVNAQWASTAGAANVNHPRQGNRIVKRVCQLDASWAKLRDRPVSATVDRAASRALQLAIMAFATQWAQGSQRSAAHYSVDDAMPFAVEGEFDRLLQQSCWHKARRALQDSADCESFRVVLAHVIFSFTQKPLDLGQEHVAAESVARDASGDGDGDAARLDDIIESEGPPIFLETATRQVFAHRAKLHRTPGGHSSASLASKLEPADRKTFDMMFWLCVMFDTLSAVMNDRPLVVSDKDSDIHTARDQDAAAQLATADLFADGAFSATLPEESHGALWGDMFLKPRHLHWNQGVPRWPCSYEEAASTLCNASPVKVLLYRKVARLQTLMSRPNTKADKVETAIAESLNVYQHWNDTYARFFADCLQHHDSLPPRIQSWHVILAGHWHLAALSLADALQRIDDASLGLAPQRERRARSRLASTLRRENAVAVAELGRVSSPSADASFARAFEFHFAVNKGALLTEPWTVVLVRAFAKAARVLLDEVAVPSSTATAAVEYLRFCEYCIKALWYLGRKSDMAYLAASLLSNNLKTKTVQLAAQQQEQQQQQQQQQQEQLFAMQTPTGAVAHQHPHQYEHQPQPQPRRPIIDTNYYNHWQGWDNAYNLETSLYATM